MLNLTDSIEKMNTAKKILPGGVNSPVRSFAAVDGTPPFIQSAKGPYLFDVDGNRYIDYVGSWGPMILGHAHPSVIAAVNTVSQRGLSFGAPCELETQLAHIIQSHMPSLEKIRMVNSGTEATMSALRLARATTRRDKFIKFNGCYHGHADSFLVKAGSGALTLGKPSSAGVTSACAADTLVAEFNDIDSVEKLFKQNPTDIAAIIIEPIAGNMNMIKPQHGFLKSLRELCDQYGALLIFDEVMTGFRVALGGAQTLYNVIPDLTTLGKIIGGGLPVGAFGGRRDLMDQLAPDGDVYQAGTLSGNPIAMTAGIATLNLLKQEHYSSLHKMNQILTNGLIEAGKTNGVAIQGQFQGGMFGFSFTEKDSITNFKDAQSSNNQLFSVFHHEMLSNGAYLAPSQFEAGFTSLTHSKEDITTTISTADQILRKIKKL